MGKNVLKQNVEDDAVPNVGKELDQEEKQVPKKKKKTKVKKESNSRQNKGNLVKGILDGSILSRKFVIRSIPMILLFVLLGIIFITNRYWIENTSIEINSLKKDLEQLRIKHIETKQEYMRASTLTEIARALDTTGIEQSTERPQKIIINKEP